jgi:hypothetical protein
VRGEGSCNLVKVARPELLMERGIVRTQAGQLDLHICAVIRRRERDLNYCGCRRRFVASWKVPSDHEAVRGIDFEVVARDRSPAQVKVERVPGARRRHEMKRWMASLALS